MNPPAAQAPAERHPPLSQCLLLIDAHVEEDWLHPQQHATLDLSGQGVEQRSWQRDPHIKAITSEERESRDKIRTLRVGDRSKAYFRAFVALWLLWFKCPLRP